ncbi:hypothetical protein FPHYL_2954 [Fusarium phyllophilum]|uniref:Uncharacterized protein n=1 Tax=Fusarium phyllophilum TaxID=47803 RepID=A0A8H5K5D1_9HYPO|nr:hypothetical protein FPHYL_2954 [Fusarium phyllophilum]
MPRTDVILLTEKELKTKIAQARTIPDPEPSKETKSHDRWIQGIVRNYTQFEFRVRNPPYFYSGRYETSPNMVLGFSVGQFTAVNHYLSPTGATGGNAWELEIELGLYLYLAFGFTNPRAGTFKSAVVESLVPREGYDKAKEGGNKIVSKDSITGRDTEGEDMTILFEVECTGGQRPVYTITQRVI